MVLYFTQSRGTTSGMALESVLQELLIDGDVEGYRERSRRATDAVADLERFTGLYLDATNSNAYYVVSTQGSRLSIERPGKFHVDLTPTGAEGRFTLEGSTVLTFETTPAGPSPAFLFPSGGKIEREVRYVPAPGLPDVDEVLASIRSAHGIEHLAELGGVRLTGTITLPQRKMSGKVELLFDAERCRLVGEFGPVRNTLWVTAQRRVWTQASGGEITEAEGAERIEALRTHPAYGYGGWKQMGRAVEVLKRNEIREQRVLLLRTTSEDAPGASELIEETTGLLRGEDLLQQIPGVGVVGVEIRYGDFRDVGKAKLPFTLRTKFAHPLIGEIIIQYEKVELGVEVGDKLDPAVKKTGE
jgi:hypothetical protein